MSGRCFLSVKSIGADQSAAEVQSVQEIFERGDFVGFGRDFDLTADDFGLGIQGAEQLDGLAVDFGGGADAFAIDGQGADAQILEMRAKPATEAKSALKSFGNSVIISWPPTPCRRDGNASGMSQWPHGP